jgi:hypothetical protein
MCDRDNGVRAIRSGKPRDELAAIRSPPGVFGFVELEQRPYDLICIEIACVGELRKEVHLEAGHVLASDYRWHDCRSLGITAETGAQPANDFSQSRSNLDARLLGTVGDGGRGVIGSEFQRAKKGLSRGGALAE